MSRNHVVDEKETRCCGISRPLDCKLVTHLRATGSGAISLKMMDTIKRIETLFNPKSIAVIGASKTIGKWGFKFVLHPIKGGYKGKIYPVNPSGGELLGQKIYTSVEEIPEPVDLAFILLPPQKVADAIRSCGKVKIPTCVVITAGFKEIGAEGDRLEADIKMAADAADVAMVGPNCAGMLSAHPYNLHSMMQPAFPPPGQISILSQSGNVAGSLLHMLDRLDIGISRCVSVGNQAQLNTTDFLEYMIDDAQTSVVMAYIESVADGSRFMDVARRLTKVKPLLVVKGGQTNTGTRAAKSHTGAIAGSADVFAGMCRQCGIIQFKDVEDMIDAATAFISLPLPKGNRVGIVANGGGWGVLTADACIEAGLDVVELSSETLELLDKRLPPWWNRQNPVDMVAGMSRGAFFKAAEILCQSDQIDSIIIQGFGYGNANANVLEPYADENGMDFTQYKADTLNSDIRGFNFILDLVKKYQKPVLQASEYTVGADKDQNEAILEFRKNNMLIFPTAQRPADVLARLVRYSHYKVQIN